MAARLAEGTGVGCYDVGRVVTTENLRSERSRLEGEIAGLRDELRLAESAIARHASATSRRGFWVGLLVGAALVGLGLLCAALAWFVEYVRFMSHMG